MFIYLFLIFAFTHAILSAQTKQDTGTRQNAKPCVEKTENRQFDFWIGEWVVTSQGQPVATSKIQSIVDGCVIYEQYSQSDVYTGQSFNFYNFSTGKWQQTWIDSVGNVSEFSGVYKDGAMHYDGASYLQNGSKVLRKMIVYNLGKDRVRQYSERSTDDGKTWSVAYDFIYIRKK